MHPLSKIPGYTTALLSVCEIFLMFKSTVFDAIVCAAKAQDWDVSKENSFDCKHTKLQL